MSCYPYIGSEYKISNIIRRIKYSRRTKRYDNCFFIFNKIPCDNKACSVIKNTDMILT